MAVTFPFYGQSNLDLSLQLIGSLDGLVSLLNNNDITDIINPGKKYNSNSNDVLNISNVGTRYATLKTGTHFFDPSFFDPSFFE